MNKQTENFLNALKDIEEGKVVELDRALNEEPPSEELQRIFRDIEKLDAVREAWQKMFYLQSNLAIGLEMDKIRLEKEIEGLKKEVQMYKDIVRLSDHLEKEKDKKLKKEAQMLEKLVELNMRDLWDIADQRDWYYEEYRKLKDRLNVS